MIDLYSSPTPNGYKTPALLAEMGVDCNLIPVDLSKNEQKTPEFLARSCRQNATMKRCSEPVQAMIHFLNR